MKKPAEKEGITKEGKVNRVETSNSKDLLKIGKVRDLNDLRKIGKVKDLSDHPKIEADKDNRDRLKTGMGKDLSGRINLEAIARDNPTVSKITPKTGTINPIGPQRVRMVPKRTINKSC